MVNYHFASAATFLALTSLTAINIQAEERPTNLRRNDEHHRLRKLYGDGLSNSHFVSDTVTECEEVMDGNPPVCIKVCVEVTSITSGEKLVDETSKVSQSKCESTNTEEETTQSPTNHPTYLATELVAEDDKTNIVTRTYSPDIMKLAGEEEEIESSSAIDWIGDGFPSTTASDSNGVIQTGSSSKSSKNGFVSSSKGGKIASSAKSFKGELVSSKSSKSIVGDVENAAVISNGWSGSAQTTSDNIIVSSKSSKYRTYSENSSDVLDANGWYSSTTSVDGESSSKSNKSGVASDGSVGSSKSSKSEGLDETVAISNGWSGSAQTDSSAIGSGSKSSKSEEVETAAITNGWSGSAQTVSSAIGSGSKSSKSEEVVDTGATSNGWSGSAQTVSPAIGSGSKSSKSEEVETVTTSNGWSGSAQTVSSAAGSSSKSSKLLQEPNGSVSSSKGGKGGDSGDANVEVVPVAKPQTSNAWQSSGWQ